MKKNGYTIYDILIVIGVLAVSALIVLPSVTHALKEYDNKDNSYGEILKTYLLQAESYGQTIKEDVKASNNYYITVQDLIDKGYVRVLNNNSEVIDIRDNITKMNNIKIKLRYDEENDKVIAEKNN